MIPRILRFIEMEAAMERLLGRALTDTERNEVAEHCGLTITPGETPRKPAGVESTSARHRAMYASA